jgi:hypothetical protein
MVRPHSYIRLALVVAMLFICTLPALAQDDAKSEGGWYFEAELSSVSASGNQKSINYGLSTKLGFEFPRSVIGLEGGGFLQESTIKADTAIGTSQSDIDRVESSGSPEKTAEAYYARGRYDFSVSKFFYVFVGADWLRNTFAGIDSRTLLAGGLGNSWVNTDKVSFNTDYSATYTFQEDAVENPFTNTKFAGVRISFDFEAKLSQAATLESSLTSDFNVDNTDDVRLNFYAALPISVSSILAFKPSARLLWRNQPSLTTVPLAGPGVLSGTMVTVPLNKLDGFYSLALLLKI